MTLSMEKTLFSIPEEIITRRDTGNDSLPEYRTQFMRDRDRIMYCTAFRRLAGKTQVYTIGNDDHKKNRLTHSLEVAQISKTIAHALHLDEDLAEAIALGHDLGHTPFGHAGEEMLHEIMIPMSKYIKGSPFYLTPIKEIEHEIENQTCPNVQIDYSLDNTLGFKHNIQSIRVSSVLEDNYRDSKGNNIGLNISNYTLWGMVNHSKLTYKGSRYDIQPNFQKVFSKWLLQKNRDVDAWSFEAYIVRIADDIAQWHHDLEDALRGNAVSIEKICETIINALHDKLGANEIEALNKIKVADRKSIAIISHIVINTLINDLYDTSSKNLNTIQNQMNIKFINKSEAEKSFLLYSSYDSLELPIDRKNIIAFSNDKQYNLFKETIHGYIHHSKDVERMNGKGQYIIRKLFEAYYTNPQQLPDGPILHFMVDIGKYQNIDIARENGTGLVRTGFDEALKNLRMISKILLMRRICDHIASMTDRYAIEEYNSLYG